MMDAETRARLIKDLVGKRIDSLEYVEDSDDGPYWAMTIRSSPEDPSGEICFRFMNEILEERGRCDSSSPPPYVEDVEPVPELKLYVDPKCGSDDADGLTETTPVRTFAKASEIAMMKKNPEGSLTINVLSDVTEADAAEMTRGRKVWEVPL